MRRLLLVLLALALPASAQAEVNVTASNTTVEGQTISGTGNCVTIAAGLTNVTIRNNVIHNCGGDGIHFTRPGSDGHGTYTSHSLIEGNTISNVGTADHESNDLTIYANSTTVKGNDLTGTSNDAVDLWGDHLTFTGDRIHDISNPYGNHDDAFQSWTGDGNDGYNGNALTNLTIERERIENITGSNAHAVILEGPGYGPVTFAHNVVSNTGSWGLILGVWEDEASFAASTLTGMTVAANAFCSAHEAQFNARSGSGSLNGNWLVNTDTFFHTGMTVSRGGNDYSGSSSNLPLGPGDTTTPITCGEAEAKALAPANLPGHPIYRLDAASWFDRFAGETSWLQAHISRVLGYPTFSDRYTSLVPTLGYHDAYTTWGTNGLNPSRRAEYVALVKRDAEHGYTGSFLDDIEFHSGFNLAGSEAEVANLVEAVRAAIPTGIVEINTQYADLWPRMKEGDPEVARALANVNMVDKEFGVSSASGINTPANYADFLTYVKTLHAKNVHIDLVSSPPGDLYSLATYLLINDGGDYIGAHAEPPGWWAGFDTNLGNTVTPTKHVLWEVQPGVYKRLFERGVVFAAAPGVGTLRLTLPASVMYDVNGAAVEETITLSGGQGAVLHY